MVVKDDELLELPSGQQLAKLPAAERADVEARRAAVALRRLLRSHRKEQVGGGGMIGHTARLAFLKDVLPLLLARWLGYRPASV